MKILFLLPNLDVGGLQRVQVTLANALSRRGHQVTVVTYGRGNDKLADELDGKVKYLPKGLKPHPIMGRIPYVRHKFYDDGMWERRTSPKRLHAYYVGNKKYDVEIAFFRGLSVKTISGYSRGSKSKHLAWVHSDFRYCGGFNFEFKNNQAVADAYRKMDAVICVSEDARRGFIEILGDSQNCCVIHNPLPIRDIILHSQEVPAKVIKPHTMNLVLVGHVIDKIKGHTRLLYALSRLVTEGHDIGLTIVGDGVDRTTVEHLIQELNLQNSVTITGEVKNPYPYIRRADLLVCSSYYEGYNLTVAEALILGTPVLSTRCTGPVEILDDGKYGMIVENSTEGLTDGLRRMAIDTQLYNYYKEKAKERLDFFNEDRIISQIEQCFK